MEEAFAKKWTAMKSVSFEVEDIGKMYDTESTVDSVECRAAEEAFKEASGDHGWLEALNVS